MGGLYDAVLGDSQGSEGFKVKSKKEKAAFVTNSKVTGRKTTANIAWVDVCTAPYR